MLTDAELASIRASCGEWLPSSCVIGRHTQLSDGGGGYTDTWTGGIAVACRLTPVAGGETDRTGANGDRIDEATTHILTLPAGTAINEADRVTIDERTYEVTLVRVRPRLEAARRVEVREAT